MLVSSARLGSLPKSGCIPTCLPRVPQIRGATREVAVGELDSAILALWTNYRAHYPDPSRPIHSALIKFYTQRLTEFLEVVVPASSPLTDLQAALPELARLSSLLKEISSYLGENPLFMAAPPGMVGEFLLKQGFSFSDARNAAELAEKNSPGRPPSVRIMAVKALELRISQKMSWGKLAMKLCECGERVHGHKCSERIRQAVMALQEILKKYEIVFI